MKVPPNPGKLPGTNASEVAFAVAVGTYSGRNTLVWENIQNTRSGRLLGRKSVANWLSGNWKIGVTAPAVLERRICMNENPEVEDWFVSTRTSWFAVGSATRTLL